MNLSKLFPIASQLLLINLPQSFTLNLYLESKKQGIQRAMMNGYCCDDGELPAHNKSSFTVRGMITLIILVFLHTVSHLPISLLLSMNSKILLQYRPRLLKPEKSYLTISHTNPISHT